VKLWALTPSRETDPSNVVAAFGQGVNVEVNGERVYFPNARPQMVGGRVLVPLRGVMVRKEPKQHGTGRTVEGPFQPGESIAIVEDVVTTGGSSLLAIERCEEAGLKVQRVLAIIDRLEGGREAFAARGYELTTLFTVRDFGITS